jgi:excisionase family DNA binding protein
MYLRSTSKRVLGGGMQVSEVRMEHDEKRAGGKRLGEKEPGREALRAEAELRVQRTEEELRAATDEGEAGSDNVHKRIRPDRERLKVPTRREEVDAEDRTERQREGRTAHPENEEATYTTAQAAEVLGISRRRVSRMLKAGELEGTQDPKTGRWRMLQRTVHALLKEERSDRSRTPRKAQRDETVPGESSAGLAELVAEVRNLSQRLGASEARLELSEKDKGSLRENLDRERQRADTLEIEADRLQAQLEELQAEFEEARRSWWDNHLRAHSKEPRAEREEEEEEEEEEVRPAPWRRLFGSR